MKSLVVDSDAGNKKHLTTAFTTSKTEKYKISASDFTKNIL